LRKGSGQIGLCLWLGRFGSGKVLSAKEPGKGKFLEERLRPNWALRLARLVWLRQSASWLRQNAIAKKQSSAVVSESFVWVCGGDSAGGRWGCAGAVAGRTADMRPHASYAGDVAGDARRGCYEEYHMYQLICIKIFIYPSRAAGRGRAGKEGLLEERIYISDIFYFSFIIIIEKNIFFFYDASLDNIILNVDPTMRLKMVVVVVSKIII